MDGRPGTIGLHLHHEDPEALVDERYRLITRVRGGTIREAREGLGGTSRRRRRFVPRCLRAVIGDRAAGP